MHDTHMTLSRHFRLATRFLAAILGANTAAFCATPPAPKTGIEEFAIKYPTKTQEYGGSTHEITFGKSAKLWITGQNYDEVVEMDLDGKTAFHSMPKGSGPHGIEFDAANQLWLTLEFSGKIVRLDAAGGIAAQYDVALNCTSSKDEINTHPHGLGIDTDGKTVWFTGKSTGTIGKLKPEDGTVQTFAIPTVGSVPIYIKAGPDRNMWFTELVGNKIGRITPNGVITEFSIPTPNSRPIAIIPEPNGGNAMWFTEEAGNKIGRIDMDGNITEFPIPMTEPDAILAAAAFDSENNLWVQQYVNCGASCHSSGSMTETPAGPDHVIKLDKSILNAKNSDISNVPMTYYQVPTRKTVMHRIICGPDENLWFTELNADKVGKVILKSIPVSAR